MATERNAEQTRTRILEAAREEILQVALEIITF